MCVCVLRWDCVRVRIFMSECLIAGIYTDSLAPFLPSKGNMTLLVAIDKIDWRQKTILVFRH